MGDSVSSETLSWVLSHFTGIRKLFLRGVIGHGMDNAIDSHDVKNMVSQSVCNIICVYFCYIYNVCIYIYGQPLFHRHF